MPRAPSKSRGSGSKAGGDGVLYNLARRVGTQLAARGLRLVTAESCTGGWIAKSLTDVAGSSGWFADGYVAYSNQAKQRDLGVPARVLEKHGAVSRPTVEHMARGALERSRVDVAVSVSGIAGPDGGTASKPVGTVWIGWAERRGRGQRVRASLHHFKGDREAIRRQAVVVALQGLLVRGSGRTSRGRKTPLTRS